MTKVYVGAFLVLFAAVGLFSFVLAVPVMLLWNYLFTGDACVLATPLQPIGLWQAWCLALFVRVLTMPVNASAKVGS